MESAVRGAPCFTILKSFILQVIGRALSRQTHWDEALDDRQRIITHIGAFGLAW